MSTMVAEKMISIKEIEHRAKKSNTYLRAVLCRPEFNKFRRAKNHFFDCEGFWSALSYIMYLKDSKAQRNLAKLYPCGG